METYVAGSLHGGAEMRGVAGLYGAACADGKVRRGCTHGVDAFSEAVEGSRNAADRVMNFRGPIQGYDNFVRAFDYARGIALQQQAGAQDGGAYAASAQQHRKAEQVGVHQ